MQHSKAGSAVRRRDTLLGYLMVAPAMICVLVLVLYPLCFAIWISFTSRGVGQSGEFVGVDNFVYLFNQPRFHDTVWNTIVLIGSVQTLKLLLGIGIALLLSQPIRRRSFWRAIVLLPWVIPSFVVFMTWRLLYAPQGGAFNTILLSLGLVEASVDFLGTRALAMPSVIVATVWSGFPFWVVSFLTALQNVPDDLYEAAALDGANALQRFVYVTLPSIRHVILIVILISTIWTTNDFENVWLLTQGGPSNATMTFPVLAYVGLQTRHIGEAAAVSVTLLPLFIGLALLLTRLIREN